jgi:hypothetical protein
MMRKLIVQQWVTVDNIAAEEDGGLGFVSGEPFSETTEDRQDLKLLEATAFGNGVALLRYGIEKRAA